MSELAHDKDQMIQELFRCRNWIEDALAYSGDTHKYKDIVDGVLGGHMQLWAGESGCAVTEISLYPNGKHLHVFLAAGDMDQVLDFQESAIQFGKMNGCNKLTLAGRPGWKRVLKDDDWREAFVVLSKEI